MVWRRGAGLAGLPMRCLHGCWNQVVHEGSALHVSALVVADFLHEGDGQALRDDAMNLTFDDHRIDNVAAVIHGHEPAYLDLAGTLVDIDHADVGAERESKIRRVIIVDRLKAWL